MNKMIEVARQGVGTNPVIGVDLASQEGDYTAELLLMLSAARQDERRNLAVLFSSRLEAIACFITKRGMTSIEAVEALRLEAERIQNESEDIH